MLECIDQTHTVVGAKSLFVTNKLPSEQNVIMEMPWAGILVLEDEAEVGGFAGCGAVM